MSLTQYRTQLLLDESRYQWLVEKAKREDKSIAAIVRQLIDQTKDNRSKTSNRDIKQFNQLKSIIGLVKKGKKNVSIKHDYYLAKTILHS